MLQSLDPKREQFLASLQSLDQRINRAQQQISSGLRINQASDDPGALGDVFQLTADLGRVSQVTSNLNLVQGEVNTAEGALQSANNVLDQVISAGTQGGNGLQTATTRAALAKQVESALSQLVNLSRSTYDGRYLFSGDKSLLPAYELNLTNANGVDRLQTAPSTRQVQDSNGVGFPVSKTAGEIFDHRNSDDTLANDNVFAAVNSLRVALANNDQAGISAALGSLKAAQDYLAGEQMFYGAAQERITNALDVAQKFQLQWQTSLGQVRDADIAEATTELTQERVNQQAALASQASIPRTSLFDFLR